MVDSKDTIALELPCVDPVCTYKTPKLEYANASDLLKLHTEVVHPAAPQPQANCSHGGGGEKPNKLVTSRLEMGKGSDKFDFWKEKWTV